MTVEGPSYGSVGFEPAGVGEEAVDLVGEDEQLDANVPLARVLPSSVTVAQIDPPEDKDLETLRVPQSGLGGGRSIPCRPGFRAID